MCGFPASSCFPDPCCGTGTACALCWISKLCLCRGGGREGCSGLPRFMSGPCLLCPTLLATPATQHSKKCWEQFSNSPSSALLLAHSPHVHLSIVISSPQSLLTHSNFHCFSVLLSQQWCILYGSWMQSSCIGWIRKLTVVCTSGLWQGADMNSQRGSTACA